MLDVKRYNEIKAMSDEERIKLAESLGIEPETMKTSIVCIMAAENNLADPEMAERRRIAFNIR